MHTYENLIEICHVVQELGTCYVTANGWTVSQSDYSSDSRVVQ